MRLYVILQAEVVVHRPAAENPVQQQRRRVFVPPQRIAARERRAAAEQTSLEQPVQVEIEIDAEVIFTSASYNHLYVIL